MEEFGKLEERVVLVGVQTDDHDNVEESLDELKELASTAGAVTVGRIIQNRESVHPGTYIGKGKIEEVRALVYAMDATGIICDDELSPAQLNNLERELDCKVMDRTLLILDIFAARAITVRVKYRYSLHSFATDLPVWSVSGNLFPVWEVESEPEVRERKSWRQTVVLSVQGSLL